MQPEVKHKVRMRDLEAWLESNGRSPAEMVLKSRRREHLMTGLKSEGSRRFKCEDWLLGAGWI
jgi:hypothetical protein